VKRARVATVAGIGAVAAVTAPALTAVGPVRRRLTPRLAGAASSHHIALTFDDGPDPSSTPHFLDLLAQHNRGPPSSSSPLRQSQCLGWCGGWSTRATRSPYTDGHTAAPWPSGRPTSLDSSRMRNMPSKPSQDPRPRGTDRPTESFLSASRGVRSRFGAGQSAAGGSGAQTNLRRSSYGSTAWSAGQRRLCWPASPTSSAGPPIRLPSGAIVRASSGPRPRRFSVVIGSGSRATHRRTRRATRRRHVPPPHTISGLDVRGATGACQPCRSALSCRDIAPITTPAPRPAPPPSGAPSHRRNADEQHRPSPHRAGARGSR
jgi:hypothetical protein